MFLDFFTYLRELPKKYWEIGSLFPSSRFLARVMVIPVKEHPGPRKILEVGPGTGSITRHILKVMQEEDDLFVCEINPRMVARLKKSLVKNPHYLSHQDRVTFIEAAVQTLRRPEFSQRFDIIICSLPFTIFTPEVVKEIIEVFQYLLAPGGRLTFFEYLGLRKVSALFAPPKLRDQFLKVDELLKEWRKAVHQNGGVRTKVSLLNFPPAIAVQLRS